MRSRDQNENSSVPNGEMAGSDHPFVAAMAARKFGIHGGTPYIGGAGYILPLPTGSFDWFNAVPEPQRAATAQALAEFYANRVVQPAAKAKGATRETVAAALTKVINEGLGESNIREKDPIETAAEQRFRVYIESKLEEQGRDKKPEKITWTEYVDNTVAKYLKTPRGQELMQGFRGEAIEAGTYEVEARGKKAEDAAELAL